MARRRLVLVAALLVALWILAAIATESINPMDTIERLIAVADDLTGATRLTHVTENESGDVDQSPESLAAAASEVLGQEVGVEEYALARMLRNERTPARKGGNQAEAVAIVWVALNDANQHNGGDIVRCITGGKGFGHQLGRKYASGRNDPYDVDLELVRQCMNGELQDPTGGRTHFMHRDGFKTRAEYLAAVKKWTGYGWENSGLDVGTSLEVWT